MTQSRKVFQKTNLNFLFEIVIFKQTFDPTGEDGKAEEGGLSEQGLGELGGNANEGREGECVKEEEGWGLTVKVSNYLKGTGQLDVCFTDCIAFASCIFQ